MLRVYISYRDDSLDKAITIAKLLMIKGCIPFLPRLNKLVDGRSDDEWVRYYISQLYVQDCLWATDTARAHEIAAAMNFGIPVIHNEQELSNVHLPKYGELAKDFSKFLATSLELQCPSEEWRTGSQKSGRPAVQELEMIIGKLPALNPQQIDAGSKNSAAIQARCVEVATLALKVWDLEERKKKAF